MNHRRELVVLTAVSIVLLAGCATNGESPGAPSGITPGATPPASVSQPPMATPSSSQPATPAAAGTTVSSAVTAALPAEHSTCLVIKQDAATTVLSSTATSSAVTDTSNSTQVHIDRCSYQSSSGTLGYQIDRFTGLDPATVVQSTAAALANQPGAEVVKLGVGSSSVGFVVAAGPVVMGRGFVAMNSTVGIDISVTASDSATAKQRLVDVARRLAAAVG